jgi:cytochrome c-type biogenesis protein CcmH
MAALLGLALVAVVVPLWRPARRAPLASNDSNIALWRSERRAIEAEFSSGLLSQDERDLALVQLTERAAEEVLPPAHGDLRDPTLPAARPARRLAVALAVAVCIGAVILYINVGNVGFLGEGMSGAAPVPQGADPKVLAMVDSLAQKMQSRPDDVKGWMLLGRSQFVLGRYHQAVEAYQHAYQLDSKNATLMADFADALAMDQGRRIAGRPLELVLAALAIDPNNLKALELAGSAALEAHDARAAIGYWERLYRLLPPDSEDARQVADAVTNLRVQAGLPPAPQASAAKPGTSPGATLGAAPAATANAAPPGAPGAPGGPAGAAGRISGRIDIDPALARHVALTDVVFVYARAAAGDGQAARMPLAVQRFAARELPREFELTDAMAMAPGHNLSSAKAVIVEARISKSGNAMPSSGDLVGRSASVAPGASHVQIQINTALP